MTNLTILIGVAGSGKSTWARQHCVGARVYSGDEIRRNRFGDHRIHDHDAEVYATLKQAARSALLGLEDVIVEDGLTPAWRREFIQIGRDEGARVHAVVFDNIDVAWERNLAREAPTSREVFARMMDRYREALATIRDEGFDTITRISEFGEVR